jgi:hypothetical protein
VCGLTEIVPRNIWRRHAGYMQARYGCPPPRGHARE